MMEKTPSPSAASIRDKETLEAWLQGREHGDGIAIAHRAALRVFPLYGREMPADWAHKEGVTSLQVMRCHLISAVGALIPTAEIGRAATTAATAAASFDYSAATSAADADIAAAGADSAALAAMSVVYVSGGASAVAIARSVDAAGYGANASAAAWEAVRGDAQALESGRHPLTLPLWLEAAPKHIQAFEVESIDAWNNDPPERWEFWRRWYAAAKAGQYLDQDLQLAVVNDVPEDLWTVPDAPDKVAKAIRQIEAEFSAHPSSPEPSIDDTALEEVISATPNAESLEFSREIEAIHVLPLSDLPADHLRDALDRLTDASEVFGAADRFDNQYLSLLPDIEKLRRALERYADRPLRLHDVAADLNARLDIRISNGECPETDKDALVASYKADLAGAMVDLQAHDPRVAEAVKARLAQGIDRIEAEDAEALSAGVEAATQITDDVLRTELQEDLETIGDPHASPEECRQAFYRLGSRLPRILWVYRKETFVGFTALTGVGTGLEWSVSTIIRIFGTGG